MNSIFTSCPHINTPLPPFPPPHQNFPFPSKRRITFRRFTPKSSYKPRYSLRIASNSGAIRFLEVSRSSEREKEEEYSVVEASRSSICVKEEDELVISTVSYANSLGNLLKHLAKPTVLALFCVVVGFCPIGRFRASAFAAPVASEARLSKKEKKELDSRGHEYSGHTRRLLDTVSVLIRRVEEVRKSNGDIEDVEEALKAVKLKKEELQREILNGFYTEFRELIREKEGLVKRSEEIIDKVLELRREHEKLLRKVGGGSGGGGEEVKERMARLEESVNGMEEEYNGIWEKVGDIEDQVLKRETMALSVGVREISFIARESEVLVERFRLEMRRRGKER